MRSSPVGQGADQGENKNCPDRHTEDEEQSIFFGLAAHVTQLRLLFAQHLKTCGQAEVDLFWKLLHFYHEPPGNYYEILT